MPPKTTAKATAKGKSPVRVRCYRQGLGDCFLLSFDQGSKRPRHVLIDCGVWPKSPECTQTMVQIAKDIAKETDNHLDVLVATHEHWDHLSGFDQARDVFDKIRIDQIWFAWTENPEDDLANELRKEKKKQQKVVELLQSRLASLRGSAPSKAEDETLTRVESLLGFLGATGGAKRGSTGEAMDYLKKRADATVRYHLPGKTTKVPGVDDVRVHILGPPHDRKKIKRDKPSKAHSEVYEFAGRLGFDDSLLAALGGLGADAGRFQDPDRVGKPFDRSRTLPLGKLPAEMEAFRKQRYANEAWRMIDHDWLMAGGAIALRLDSATNNTSLVLAFELQDGRVLLFAADAQVGNWLSWHDPDKRWKTVGPGGEDASVTAEGLLAKTVLYKVGHHGSHNATLRELGLEMMTSPDLMAVIPVSHQMALDNGWGRIPLPSLIQRLREKTRGRTWFTVEHQGKFTNPVPADLAELTQKERERVKATVKAAPLWIDFHL